MLSTAFHKSQQRFSKPAPGQAEETDGQIPIYISYLTPDYGEKQLKQRPWNLYLISWLPNHQSKHQHYQP